MGEDNNSGIRYQIEFVVHRVAYGYRCVLDRLSVGGTGIENAKGPFAVLVELQRQAGNATASRPRSHALQSNCFKFLDGLLGAVHSSLLARAGSISASAVRQGRAA